MIAQGGSHLTELFLEQAKIPPTALAVGMPMA
jgi:hypothetical protein